MCEVFTENKNMIRDSPTSFLKSISEACSFKIYSNISQLTQHLIFILKFQKMRQKYSFFEKNILKVDIFCQNVRRGK